MHQANHTHIAVVANSCKIGNTDLQHACEGLQGQSLYCRFPIMLTNPAALDIIAPVSLRASTSAVTYPHRSHFLGNSSHLEHWVHEHQVLNDIIHQYEMSVAMASMMSCLEGIRCQCHRHCNVQYLTLLPLVKQCCRHSEPRSRPYVSGPPYRTGVRHVVQALLLLKGKAHTSDGSDARCSTT